MRSGSRSPSTAEGIRSPTATDVAWTDLGRRKVRRNDGYRGRRRGRWRMVGADGRHQGVTVGSATTGHACQPTDDQRRPVAFADTRTPSGGVYSVFFQNRLPFQSRYIVLIHVARWRPNFCEIVVKNCENPKNRRKSLCAPLR